MSVTRENYRALLAKNRESGKVFREAFGGDPPKALLDLNRSTVRRAWIGTWSPWLAGMIARWRSWRADWRKIPCEDCEEPTRGKDIEFGEDDGMRCATCHVVHLLRPVFELEDPPAGPSNPWAGDVYRHRATKPVKPSQRPWKAGPRSAEP